MVTRRKTSKGKKKKLVRHNSDNSKTSPFKGFTLEEASQPHDKLLIEEGSVFDKLLDKESYRNLHKNIRTYGNKNKVVPISPEIFEFETPKNREDIIKWLNNIGNVFDGLSQTASERVSDFDNFSEATFDLPSASQQGFKITPNEKISNLRASSLDRNIPQNANISDQRFSLVLKKSEDYSIDDDFSEKSHDKNMLAMIHLMEDECLDKLENEILENKGINSGWKTVKTNKKPKQLNIKLQVTPEKKNNIICDNNAYEKYYSDNIAKFLPTPAAVSDRFSVRNALEVGRNFVTILKKSISNNQDCVNDLRGIFSEIKLIFDEKIDKSTQTRKTPVGCTATQTVLHSSDARIQTEVCLSFQKSVQTEGIEYSSKSNQTEINKVSVEIQANPSSDLVKVEEDIFDDGLDLNFNTEEFWETNIDNVIQQPSEIKNGNVLETISKPIDDSVLVLSNPQRLKRSLPSSSVCLNEENNPPKRPCSKFFPENLSIGFDSCPDEEVKIVPELVDLQEKTSNCDNKIDVKLVKIPVKAPSGSCVKIQDDFEYFSTKASPSKVAPKKSVYKMLSGDQNSESISLSSDYNTVISHDTVCRKKEGAVSRDKIIDVLQYVVIRQGNQINVVRDEEEISRCSDDSDIVECTPQPNLKVSREELKLDITLPPPLEFQDKLDRSNFVETPRRPFLSELNKITSTPISQKQNSMTALTLSPISSFPKTQETRTTKNVVRFFSKPQKENISPKLTPLNITKKNPTNLSKQISILDYVSPYDSQDSSLRVQLSRMTQKKACITCSRLTKDEVLLIASITNKNLASYCTSFSPKVTHLIVAVNEKNCIQDHTIKYVTAVASGIWVLNLQWIKDSLIQNRLLPEEPYEVLDVGGCPGPQASRTRNRNYSLLKGYKICTIPPFISTTRHEIENLIKISGGTVVRSPEDLLDKNGSICLILTEANTGTHDFELYEAWLDALQVVTVDIEWLSRSIGQYKAYSLKPFTLCSDDTIENLGYPPELTVNSTEVTTSLSDVSSNYIFY